MFYGRPSTDLWELADGTVHHIPQDEGGEQGDPLMPLFFSLGQHPALIAAQPRLEVTEKMFAYLDDIYLVCRPNRVAQVYALLQEELW